MQNQKKRILAGLITAVLLLAMLPVLPASASAVHTYQPDYNSQLQNPERGIHNRYELVLSPEFNPLWTTPPINIGGFPSDCLNHDFPLARQKGHTLIHSYLHLDTYKDIDVLPDGLLESLQEGFDNVREAGMKCIIRPAYAWEGNGDVPMSRMLGHVAQLGEVFTANSDVIFAFEAGYIGSWGEWHASAYADFNNGFVGLQERPKLIKAILQSTASTDIPLAIRYPVYLQEMIGDHTNTLFTQEEKDRLSFHNDSYCSVNGGTYDAHVSFGNLIDPDLNGWVPTAIQRGWVTGMTTSTGFNKYVGGETDSSSSDGGEGTMLFKDSYDLNLSELNEDWNAGQNDKYKRTNLPASGNDPAETTWERLERKAGYRLRMIDAEFDSVAQTGDTYELSFNIDNDGFAGLIRNRPVYLVFDNGTVRKNIPLTRVEARKWLGGDEHKDPYNAKQTVIVPQDMPEGEYTLALWLPDQSMNLRDRPEYSVRFANLNMWDADKGYNKLGDITIANGTPRTPLPPTNITAKPGNQQVSLAWDASAWADGYEVYYSQNPEGPFTTLGGTTAGTDLTVTGLTNMTTYYFVIKATGALGTSAESMPISAKPVADPTPPPAPGGISKSNVTAVSLTLSWNSSSSAVGIKAYEIYRDGMLLATVGGSVTSFNDSGLDPYTVYTYKVRAVNNYDIYSNFSSELPVRTLRALEKGYVIEDFTRSDSRDRNNTGGSNSISNCEIVNQVLKWSGSSGEMFFQSGKIPAAKYFVVRLKAEGSASLDDVTIWLGGKTGSFSSFTTDVINTSDFTDIVIDLAANGMNPSTALTSFRFEKFNPPGGWKLLFDEVYV
ncbi:MAG: DUF4832 domain-containing protein, partial [Oscillospiraceae bacterium]|nr:DUF4832 domain-containing protein [Oscillospiraceae bacterium]